MISRRGFFAAIGAALAPKFVSVPTVKLAMHSRYGVAQALAMNSIYGKIGYYGGRVTYYGAGSLANSMIRFMDSRSAYPKIST